LLVELGKVLLLVVLLRQQAVLVVQLGLVVPLLLLLALAVQRQVLVELHRSLAGLVRQATLVAVLAKL
jgi:hypothetical protein